MIGGGAKYGRTVVEAILRGVDEAEHFVLDDRGVWVNEALYSSGDPSTEILQWHPLVEIDAVGSPDPSANPSLPFPFTAEQLAAFLLDGAGYFVRDGYGEWADGPDEVRLSVLGVQETKAREALRRAYLAYRDAEAKVGSLDLGYRQLEHKLNAKFNLANDEANRRENIHQVGIDDAEYRERRARARSTVEPLWLEVMRTRRDADKHEASWRQAMVSVLLMGHHGGQGVERPPSTGRSQERAILDWLEEHDYDPTRLPPSLKKGLPTVQAFARKALRTSSPRLFVSGKAFDDAWRRLKAEARIVVAETPTLPPLPKK